MQCMICGNDIDSDRYGFCEECLSALRSLVSKKRASRKQNEKHKLVRMADGTRRWIPNSQAVKLLALPRKERVVEPGPTSCA